LVGAGGGVAGGVAVREAGGDGVLHGAGLVGAVFELGADVGDFEAETADAGEHAAERGEVRGDGGVVAGGLEVGELAVQEVDLGFGVVDDVRRAEQLDGGVEAGGRAVLGRGVVGGCQGPGMKV
jgi:hypothetical protein